MPNDSNYPPNVPSSNRPADNASPLSGQPPKPRRLRQASTGAIIGLLTLFVPFYPVLYALQLWLLPENSFFPGVIITGLLVIILTLLTRKKFPAFAYTYLTISLLVLAFLTYLFQTLNFT